MYIFLLFNAASYDCNQFSRFWIPSSFIYADLDSDQDTDFGNRFDPNLFDEIEEPPPVHILYPRPAFNRSKNLISSVRFAYVLAVAMIIYFFHDRS